MAGPRLIEFALFFLCENRLRLWRCKPATNALRIFYYSIKKLATAVAAMKNDRRFVETWVD